MTRSDRRRASRREALGDNLKIRLLSEGPSQEQGPERLVKPIDDVIDLTKPRPGRRTHTLVVKVVSPATDSPLVTKAEPSEEHGPEQDGAKLPMRTKRTVERRDALLLRANNNLARRKGRKG